MTVPSFLDANAQGQSPQIPGRVYVPYMNLGGGQNTKKDAHAIRRDQLVSAVNCWYAYGDSLSKRPGNTAVITGSGATGSGTPGKGLYCCRFNGTTYFLVQQGTALYFGKATDVAWTAITTPLGAGAGPMCCAQMFDPSTSKDTVFICDGVSQPWTWTGPTSTVLGHATVPNNYTNAAPITPKFVATLGNNSKLFYAGEKTCPTAVYVSDAEFPQSFTTSLTASSSYAGTYFPAIIGANDGVEGGDITYIAGLGSAMIVYKQTAIYRMDETQLLGDTAFRVTTISCSRGALSSRSVVKFESFHVILCIDGVWTTGGNENDLICISADVPTYFDSTLTGFSAICQDYTTAVAGRMGNRYLIWFDDGSGSPVRGLWFDFNKLNPESGLPTCGEIQGMNMGGCAAQASAGDDGHLIWCDAGQDRVGHFGLGFADFSQPITMTFVGKADLMIEEFGEISPIVTKYVDNITALVALPSVTQGEQVTVQATIITDLLNQMVGDTNVIAGNVGGGTWGQNWGVTGSNQLVWSAPQSSSVYQTGTVSGQDVPQAYGKVIQIAFQESSTNPLTFLGYILEVNRQDPVR